jgi:hypothetical protein
MRKKTLKVDRKLGIVKVLGQKANGAWYATISLMAQFIYYACYQRAEDSKWVNTLAKAFDPRKASEPRLSLRNNKLYCIDGRQTIAAMLKRGLKTVECIVFNDLTYTKEAEYFFDWNTQFKEMAGWVNFYARVEASDPVTKTMIDIAHKHKLTLPRDRGVDKPRHADIANVSTLNESYRKGGFALLAKVCKVLACWKENGHVAKAAKDVALLRGLVKYLQETKNSMASILRVLRHLKPEVIRQIAADMPSKGRIDATQMKMAFEAVVSSGQMMKAA